MNYDEILNLVVTCFKDYTLTQNIKVEINAQTPLIGKGALLDSIGFVNVIVDVETSFLDRGFELTLLSEKAMSQKNSPFRNIAALSEFIAENLQAGE